MLRCVDAVEAWIMVWITWKRSGGTWKWHNERKSDWVKWPQATQGMKQASGKHGGEETVQSQTDRRGWGKLMGLTGWTTGENWVWVKVTVNSRADLGLILKGKVERRPSQTAWWGEMEGNNRARWQMEKSRISLQKGRCVSEVFCRMTNQTHKEGFFVCSFVQVGQPKGCSKTGRVQTGHWIVRLRSEVNIWTLFLVFHCKWIKVCFQVLQGMHIVRENFVDTIKGCVEYKKKRCLKEVRLCTEIECF